MSFASDAKKELCRLTPNSSCCIRAQACAMALFGHSFGAEAVSLITENRAVSEVYCTLISQLGIMTDRLTELSYKKRNNMVYTAQVPDGTDRQRLVELFDSISQEKELYINLKNIHGECCKASFLRGAFLSCGTATDPNKDYHLEFAASGQRLAQDLVMLLRGLEGLSLEPRLVRRKGDFVVYLKESEQITDLLTYLGAQQAAMELIQVKMVKEVRNYVNRTTNFETANIGKTASAAAQQIEAIQKIEKKLGLNELPQELRELAQLRLDNPDMSLRQLGESLSEPLSRSGVNHRLRRILELAEKI